MSSHNISLNSINTSISVKPDTKVMSAESSESDGFLKELKGLIGLNDSSDEVKKVEINSEDVETQKQQEVKLEEVDSTEFSENEELKLEDEKLSKSAATRTEDASELQSVEAIEKEDETSEKTAQINDSMPSEDQKVMIAEEKISEGSELLSRLEQANGVLVSQGKSEKDIKNDDIDLSKIKSVSGQKISEESSTVLVDLSKKAETELTAAEAKEIKEASESEVNTEALITQASVASITGKESSKSVGEITDPVKEINWGQPTTKTDGSETQAKGDALGNKESTKELLTSTALIGKAEAESGKLIDAKKAKIDISALGMNAIANGETVNLTDPKTADSFAQQLANVSGTTATQQSAAVQRSEAANVPLNLRHEQVSDEVAERINMMMAKNLKQIDIRLDPPEMGRMHIRLNMGSGTDSAGVQFTVSNQQARDAIEQTLPRLREMFAQQGIQLADTSVQQQNSGESSQYAYQQEEHSRQGGGFSEDISEEHEINIQVSKPADGISFYA